jgi:hypothetical protein
MTMLGYLKKLLGEIEIKRTNGPRVDSRTKIFANLAAFALCRAEIEKVENIIKKDVLWNEVLEFGDGRDNEAKLFILNPPEIQLQQIMPTLYISDYGCHKSVFSKPFDTGSITTTKTM